jgi:pSer/pThr/pTyr-binding forkhead associated (FHA) protein
MSPLAPSPGLTPRTLRHAIAYPRLAADAYLVIETGDTLAVINVPAGRTHVGRGFAADIELEDTTVSRRHAILIRDEAGVHILDDRSENGVHVNGVPTTGCMLRDGDRIGLGRVRLRFILAP